jgi:hypothetical protein
VSMMIIRRAALLAVVEISFWTSLGVRRLQSMKLTSSLGSLDVEVSKDANMTDVLAFWIVTTAS